MRTTPHALRTAVSLAAGLTLYATAQATDLDALPLNPLTTIERDSLQGFLERPLFDPDRRLAPVVAPLPSDAVVMPPLPPEPPPPLHLLGVIDGRRDIAIVHRDGEEKTFILRTGDHVGNWMVRVLPPAGLRLTTGKRVFDYILFGKSGDASPLALDATAASSTAALSPALVKPQTSP